MRNLYFVLFFTSITSGSILGQTYTPFLVEGKIWVSEFVAPSQFNGDCNEEIEAYRGKCSNNFYKIQGDTVLDNKVYKILWSKFKDNSSYATNNNYGIFKKYAYLREDTLTQQVFVSGHSEVLIGFCHANPTPINNNEYLIYDFDMAIGDTITKCNGPVEVYNKYYEDIFMGDTLVNTDNLFQEGVGSFYGPIEGGGIDLQEYTELRCVMVDGLTMYGECTSQLLSIANKSPINHRINLYPTIAYENIMVDSKTNHELIIYNAVGKIMFVTTLSAGENKVAVNFLPNGIYFAKSITNNGDFTTRFIKL